MVPLTPFFFAVVLACGGGDAPTTRTAPSTGTAPSPSTHDSTPVTDTGTDSDTQPTDTRTLVDVAHPRELRGAWIATVWNINFPSTTGLSAEASAAELDALVQVAADTGLNALFFQIRPEADALYSSELEPWSRYLDGTQGVDPGYDPLAYLIERAHGEAIEVHGWMNPYRAKASESSTAVAPHLSVTYPEYAYDYGGLVWMDPAAEPVRQRVVDVVGDVITRYDIDGIHFDDYFYPYPDGTEFPDHATYDAYVDGGGGLSRDDWRRDNVHQLVREVHEAVVAMRPDVRFGIAPFGIYRPGQPEGITGLDQYAELYADPVVWAEEGWLDYLAPQLYWPHDQAGQEYEPLLTWWLDLDIPVFVGNYLSQLGTSSSWDLDEFRTQVAISRDHADSGSLGNIWYNIDPLVIDTEGVRGVLHDEFYATPARPPAIPRMAEVSVSPPDVAVEGDILVPTHDTAAAFVLYRQDGAGFALVDIASHSGSFQVDPGVWAVSAVGRHGVESQAVVLSL